MDVFILSLQQLLMMALLTITGFVLRKKKLVPENTGIAMSKLETFVFMPALNIITQLRYCNVENFLKNSKLMVYGLVFILLAIAIATPTSKLFVKNCKYSLELEYKRNIYKYALTFGNYGFMGNYLVLGIWGDEVFYSYTMLTFLIGIVSCTWGLYILMPKGELSILKNLKKGFMAPPIVALFFGMICGLLNLKSYFPSFVITALDNASKCMGPVAMLLAGVVMGGYDFKELLKDKKVYIVTFLRLIVIPALFMAILNIFGTNKEIMTLLLITFATPLGMNTIIYPAAYGGETKTGASMIMISQIISVITIPVMYYIFIVKM